MRTRIYRARLVAGGNMTIYRVIRFALFCMAVSIAVTFVALGIIGLLGSGC